MVFNKILYPFFFLIIFCLCGCSSNYQNKNIFGADEFVIDSYKIKEGKFSILEMEGEYSEDLSKELLEEYKDEIANGDVLNIVVYHPTRTDICSTIHKISSEIGFCVTDGNIILPDLPVITVAGLTLNQAREKILEYYLHNISDIEVFVSYKIRAVKKVELAGLVGLSSVPVDGKMRIYDVLSLAKVPPNSNLFKSYVLRDNKPLSVDLYKLLKQGDMSQNIVMKGGDKIYIAEASASSLMVMGEVGIEKVVDLPDGSMSLRHALAQAHGIPYTGDKSYIQVIRGNIVNPKIYVLSWEHVIHLSNDSLLLMPGDIVYVASKPITEWNRFISQLLPSFTGFDVFQKGLYNVGILIP
jgi:polysaccharide biosynthesis/export protein